MNPLKGPLKLKGDVSLVSKKKSKKKKKPSEAPEPAQAAAAVDTKAEDVQPKVVHKYVDQFGACGIEQTHSRKRRAQKCYFKTCYSCSISRHFYALSTKRSFD